MATIDVERLRAHMIEHCGSAMAAGFPAALLDLADVERAGGEELCRMAERAGIDLARFAVAGGDAGERCS